MAGWLLLPVPDKVLAGHTHWHWLNVVQKLLLTTSEVPVMAPDNRLKLLNRWSQKSWP
jgi:hypothetical protein